MDKKHRILIVEDNEVVIETIKQALKDTGCKVVGVASNGVTAVEKACLLKPDVILMDIRLPEIDGLEAARRIQQECPAPVVVLTAYEDVNLVNLAGDAGVAAYLKKPPDRAEIERAIILALARFEDMQHIARLNTELQKQNKELQAALNKVKQLAGLLPICASCKKIRDDKGYWKQIEQYIEAHSEAEFSHSICPECAYTLYPELYDNPE